MMNVEYGMLNVQVGLRGGIAAASFCVMQWSKRYSGEPDPDD